MMKCPNCGKEVSNNKNFCEYCGSNIYGPRDIFLNNPDVGSNVTQSNIKSITGIDINELANEKGKEEKVQNKLNNKKKKTNIFKELKLNFSLKKIDKKVLIGGLVFLVILGCIIVLITEVFSLSKKVKNQGNTSNCNIDTYYTVTDYYSFKMPIDWELSKKEENIIIYDDKNNISILKPVAGNNTEVSKNSVYQEYQKQGLKDTTIEENTINNKKVIYAKYVYENHKYLDFYFQYDEHSLILGQANYEKNIKEVLESILSTLKINNTDMVKESIADQKNIAKIMGL